MRHSYKILDEEEIKAAIWELHPLKALGPDGFSSIFFRSCWQIVREKTINFVRECFRLRDVPRYMNHTFIVLIPKVENAVNFNQFRPISLCNFVYKIVAKILASRLRSVMDKIISPNQGAFVKRRWIADNTLVAQELSHKMKKHKGKGGLMLVKLDMKKEYDRIEWGFLKKALLGWGLFRNLPRIYPLTVFPQLDTPCY